MKIEKASYGPWVDCYRCTLALREGGEVELIAVASVGPRIISLRVNGGPNILFDDSGGAFLHKGWHIWGGHRFWIAPETETIYYPDDALCEVKISNGTLTIMAPAERTGGLQKTIEISECPVTGGFQLKHTLTNTGLMLAAGAIWGITCVLPLGRLLVPWGEGSPRTADPSTAWRTQMVRYWRHWASVATDIESRQWQPHNDTFMVEPTGENGKIGLYSDLGAVALLRSDVTFLKLSSPQPGAPYPDGGCNIEIFTCGAFMEMETLGPYRMLAHGESNTHIESWIVSSKSFEPGDWPAVLDLARL